MRDYLEYTYEIVRKSLERYLYQSEQKEGRRREERELQEISKKKNQIELTGRAKLRSILRDAKTNSKKLPRINGLSEKTFIRSETRIFVCLEMTTVCEPVISQYSNVISSSIITLLKCDLRRVIFIKEKLFGQQLPMVLRQFIWTECLVRCERKSFDYDVVKFTVMERKESVFVL